MLGPILPLVVSAALAAPWDASLLDGAKAFRFGATALEESVRQRSVPAQACPAESLEVSAQDPKDAAIACKGLRRAEAFMASLGYPPKAKVRISFTEDYPERFVKMGVTPDRVHGFVDPDTLDVYMSPFARFSKLPAENTLLDLGASEEMFVSYVAHEILHVLAGQNYGGSSKKMPKILSEYAAYAGQLATMDEPLRQKVLEAFRVRKWEPFEGPQDVNLGYHNMNPHGFAVKSYLYHLTPEGREYLRGALDGTVRETPSPEW
ncbi:MAG: DUF6639 family protein [Elusimicrobiota bacterium]